MIRFLLFAVLSGCTPVQTAEDVQPMAVEAPHTQVPPSLHACAPVPKAPTVPRTAAAIADWATNLYELYLQCSDKVLRLNAYIKEEPK